MTISEVRKMSKTYKIISIKRTPLWKRIALIGMSMDYTVVCAEPDGERLVVDTTCMAKALAIMGIKLVKTSRTVDERPR